MAYRGQTISVPCNRGGLTYNPNIDLIQPWDMVPPTRNLNLHENGRGKRGGTAHVDDSAISGTPIYLGIFDFYMRDGTQYIIRACNDGSVYRDRSNTIATSKYTANYYDFEVFDDELYWVNGYNCPMKWTGSGNASNLTDIPTDWTGTNYPQWIVKHGYGNSERMWAGGCPSNPHVVYASADGDGDDFSTANVLTFTINTGDGFGIVGAIEFGGRLILFGKRKSFILDDTASATSSWGYYEAQWAGGTANFRTLIRTPNDIVSMQEDGEIYSVIAAETYGDYKSASLARPAYMHKWINEFVSLSRYDQFHSVYDPTLRAIKAFVVRSGKTTVDTALVYFINRPPAEAWMVHGNWSVASGYSASASAVVRESAGDYKVYTGDYSGELWELETSNKNDNDKGYWAGFETGHLNFGNSRLRKNYKRGWAITEPQGEYNLNIAWWVDDNQNTTQTVSLVSSAGTLGSFVLGTRLLGGDELIDTAFDFGDTGKRIKYQVYNETKDQDFFVSQILTDFKWLGGKPA